jgi:pyrimidine-nucleoside phosphorylase
MQRTIVETIAAKRDGLTLTAEEITNFLRAFGDKKVEDYQMTAFLMAVFFRGLDDAETVALTEAMLHSGTVLDLSSVPGVKVDKHSTGGVGDKVSICLAPLVAACGVPVPMVSGRGLGHTGGTLDKLEAIPGFRTDLPIGDFARIVKECGTCMIGQTAEIAPADKRIYALRDVTATVESIPLIVASILSKKLAEGIDGLVLDVKVGKGAFMKNHESARALAEKLVSVGTRAGKRVVAVLTRMDAPLGRAIGNANETREALEVLHGKGPEDLVECTMVLGAEMLVVGKKASDTADARKKLEAAIASGDAIRAMERMVAAQGGDASVVAHPEKLAMAKTVVEVRSPQSGYVTGIDALALGLAGVAMGAGRTRAADKVDPSVGIEIDKKPGEPVKPGDVVARLLLHQDDAALVERVQSAFMYGDAAPDAQALVVDRITG